MTKAKSFLENHQYQSPIDIYSCCGIIIIELYPERSIKMSAYVVSDETINRIVSYLSYEHYQSVTHGCCKHILARAGYDVETRDGAERLASAMFNLNVEAVEQRYGKGQAREFRPLDFQYRPIVSSLAIKVFKSLEEWSYQCSEGDVPATDLYKLMSKISNAICRGIVMNSEAYRAA